MKYSRASLGRVFIIRLEDGEIIHEMIEEFAIELKANDVTGLLVQWLSELVSLADSRHMIFVDFDIRTIDKNKIRARAQGILMRHFLAGEYCSFEIATNWGVARINQRMFDLKKKFEDAGKENPIRTKTVETGGKKKYSLYWIKNRGCELDAGPWREY